MSALQPSSSEGRGPVVITGGAGFIGTNLAEHFLARGRPVIVFDNFDRAGVQANASGLKARYGDLLEVRKGDVRDASAVREVIRDAGVVYHLAAQVAVTTSLIDPLSDFEVNARGTLNVLEAIRAQDRPPPLVFTSTNKVYGNLADVRLAERPLRWEPMDPTLAATGIDEDRSLDFHSPYGCSKGTADAYVLDYARVFGLPTVVLRMSCIYGPRQLGTEDQGWVAHFLLNAVARQSLTLYGDGKQVRDLLFVEDLVELLARAEISVDALRGRAFNVGGGPTQALSLLEVLEIISTLEGRHIPYTLEGWRPADQRWFVADTHRLESLIGWRPRTSPVEGIARLHAWYSARRREEPTSRPGELAR